VTGMTATDRVHSGPTASGPPATPALPPGACIYGIEPQPRVNHTPYYTNYSIRNKKFFAPGGQGSNSGSGSSSGGSIWSIASKSVTEKWRKYVSRIQLCSLPGMMARRCRNAMVRSPNPCLATYSRCRNFWHSFVGQKRHPSNACVGREYPASTRWRTVTGNGLIHMYLTQLPRNSGPKHMAQNPQTEILVLAACAQFFDRFRGIQLAAF